MVQCIPREPVLLNLISGLKNNKTLTELQLTNLSNLAINALGGALLPHRFLRKLILDDLDSGRSHFDIENFREFIHRLQRNNSLFNILFYSVDIRTKHLCRYTTWYSQQTTNDPSQTLLRKTLKRNKELWIKTERQSCAEAAIAFSLAVRQNHKNITKIIGVPFNLIFGFLAKATLVEINRCSLLVQNNIKKREWKSSIDGNTIFKKWKEIKNIEPPEDKKTGDLKTLLPPCNEEKKDIPVILEHEFKTIIESYESKSSLSFCCFWVFDPVRSHSMRALKKINPIDGVISKKQIEDAISNSKDKYRERRLEFFQRKSDYACKTGTDSVIKQLRDHPAFMSASS